MDLYFFNLINQLAGQNIFLDKLAVFFAEYWQYVVVLSIGIFLLQIFIKNKKESLKVAGAIMVTVFLSRIIFTEIIRYFFPKDRPFVTNQINQILDHSTSASFPSGHAAFFFALAMAAYFYNKKLGVFLFISAFLISISRVFCGIHWPSDIIAGAVIGIISGWLIQKIFQKYFKQKTVQ